jgi:hypothetical protein
MTGGGDADLQQGPPLLRDETERSARQEFAPAAHHLATIRHSAACLTIKKYVNVKLPSLCCNIGATHEAAGQYMCSMAK